MYGGVGIASVRGSGTSGYVQTNKFHLRASRLGPKEQFKDLRELSEGNQTRKANVDILEHNRKRAVEMKLLVLQEQLEEQGYTEGEVTQALATQRAKFELEAEREAALTTCVQAARLPRNNA